MPASTWIRKWREVRDERGVSGTLVRAAARGDSLDRLLDLAVHALLSTGGGDRAGLWLSGTRRGETGRGRVVEAASAHVPAQWEHLDISTPYLRNALESPHPLRVELGPDRLNPDFGPMMGMQSVVWVPVRSRNYTFGLGMVAQARAGAPAHLEMLGACADEIALALSHERDSRRRELAAEELRAQLRLSRAILCGVSADSLLPQIARAARHHLQAEFVALGTQSTPPGPGEGWDGSDEWRGYLQQNALLEFWRRAFEEGRESDTAGEALPLPIGSGPEPSRAALDRLIVIPIKLRARYFGVLIAGLLPSEDSSEDFARLESYAVLAASALERGLARTERSDSHDSVLRMIEDSGENLILIDNTGMVRATSRVAGALLNTPGGPPEGRPFEDFFSTADRDAVFQWRKHLTSQVHVGASHTQFPALPVNLDPAGFVRLHLRSVVDGFGDQSKMWLLHLENQGEQRARHESERRLEAAMTGLIDSVESGVLVLDAAGHICTVNDRFGAIVGCESRRLFELGTIEALMDHLADRFHRPGETVARWRELQHRANLPSWEEFELILPTRRIVERFARPLVSPDGTPVGWLEIYRDITGQRQIQTKLLQTEKMAALGQLVSGIAHELNNPLTSIQGYAQLLLTRRSASDRTGDAQRISQEAERAGQIVKNLLLFSRESTLERRAVDLNMVVERTLALRAYDLKLENIAVELMLDPGLPHTLADAAQLQQAILNLIVNAEQAIKQGRGDDIRSGRIQLRTCRTAGERIRLEISDDGPGIPVEVSSRIFDPFFTTKAAGIGTGLGLSIVYGIVQAHGGEVTVESQAGRGARLTMELPALSVAAFDLIQKDSVTRLAAAPVNPLLTSKPSSPTEYILVVEDEPTVAELIADVMLEEGHRVDVLLDSREALLRLKEGTYGLVICDLKMPYLDGAGLYRALLRRGRPLRQKLLFVTGDTMSPRTLEFLKSSGLPYLAKPFLVDELKDAVRQAFAASPGGEELVEIPETSRASVRGK